jgi:hypothetical protein
MITFSNLAALRGIEHGITEVGDALPTDIVRGEQIHGDIVAEVKDRSVPVIPRADALVTRLPAITLAVETADCVPILFAAPRVGLVGTIHAGWRGTALEITRKVLESLKVKPFQLFVAMGPAICPNCFEVGEEVARQFPDSVVRETDDGHCTIDLWQANLNQCLEVGVPEKNIELLRRCTFEDPSLYSYRRGERGQRNLAFIRRVA